MLLDVTTTEKILYTRSGEKEPLELSNLFPYCLGVNWNTVPTPAVRDFLEDAIGVLPSVPCIVELDVHYHVYSSPPNYPHTITNTPPTITKNITDSQFAEMYALRFWGTSTEIVTPDGNTKLLARHAVSQHGGFFELDFHDQVAEMSIVAVRFTT